MSKSKKKPARRPNRTSAAVEDRRSEILTVAWMLSTMTTLMTESAGLLGLWLISRQAESPERPGLLAAFPLVMFFAACVTGIVVLCLTPVVYIVRRVRPPLAITVFAVIVAVSPLLAIVVLSSWQP